MSYDLQHELSDEDRAHLLADAATETDGRLVYRRMAKKTRTNLEDLYAFDLTHVACEVASWGLRKGKLSAADLLVLAENRVPIGDVLKRELEWTQFGGDNEAEDEAKWSFGIPDWEHYDSASYLAMLRALSDPHDVFAARFWHNCRLIIDYYTARGTRRKPTLALMGMEPEDVWNPYGKKRGRFHNPAVATDAEAAIAYEWDLLGNPDFVQVMFLAMCNAEKQGLARWTANLTVSAERPEVTILRHQKDGDDGQVVETSTMTCKASWLAQLLVHHMPRWALQSVSTEKGSSAPVFGLPDKRLFITAIRPAIWEYEWGLVAHIPRFYTWKSLRTLANRDFGVLREAMDRKQPRLGRSLDNVYSYARRIRDELRKAKWKDHHALARVQELSQLSEREVYKRLGYRGRGGEGPRRSN